MFKLETSDEWEEFLVTNLEALWRSEGRGSAPAILTTEYPDTAAAMHLHLLYPGGGDISHCVQLSTSYIGDTAAICEGKVERPITNLISSMVVVDLKNSMACH